MVNQVLQTYLRSIERHFRHLPTPLRRRLVAEVTGHIILEVASQRRERPDADEETVAREVIEEFCPVDEMLVAYGPEGGILRRSTGKVVLRSNVLSTGPARRLPRTFLLSGAAAAGWVLFAGLLAVVGLALLPALLAPEDPAVMGADPDFVLSWSFVDQSGDLAYELPVAVENTTTIEVVVTTEAGCASLTLVAPDGTEHDGGGCEPTLVVATPQAGTWTLRLHLESFTGEVRVQVTRE